MPAVLRVPFLSEFENVDTTLEWFSSNRYYELPPFSLYIRGRGLLRITHVDRYDSWLSCVKVTDEKDNVHLITSFTQAVISTSPSRCLNAAKRKGW